MVASRRCQNESSTVLIIEDDRTALEELVDSFRLDGYHCVSATTVEEAIAALDRESSTDVVVSDINLGTRSGLEVLAQMRRDGRDTQFIVMTGAGRTEDAIEALRLGASDFIEKPIAYSEMAQAVGRALNIQSAKRSAIHTQVALKRDNGALLERNEHIRSLLGRYVDDGIVRELLEHPEALQFGGARTRATILVSDLRGFTELSERLDAENVLALLNNYFRAMIDVVRRHGGTVDNLVGDALMAVFGVPDAKPDDAIRAAACALEMQLYVADVNALNREAGLPEIQMGIGVNTGDVVAGNIGCERHAKYSVIGSPVNRAWRIESFTVGGQILASRETIDEAGSGIEISGKLRVKLRGVHEPVEICEIAGVNATEH